MCCFPASRRQPEGSCDRHPFREETATTDNDLHTPICSLLGCNVPILLAGMGGVVRSELVAAVAEAGGYGILGMVRETP